MKKFFSIVAVAVAMAVWYVLPAVAATFDVSGDERVRGFIVQSQDFTKNGDSNWLDARFRTNLVVKQGMSTGVVQVDFLNNNTMNPTNSANGNLVLGNSTGSSLNLLGVRQAYLAINFPHHTLIAGRYELKLGNGLVLNDTTDLVAVVAPLGPVNLLVGYLVLSDDDDANKWETPPVTAPNSMGTDATALAINADLNAGGWDWNLFAVFAQISTLGPTDSAKLNTYGLTGAGKAGPVRVMGELDLFGGDATATSSYKGTNLLLAGSMPVGAVDLGAAIIYASGLSSSSTDTDVHAILNEGDFRASNILIRDDFNNYDGVAHLDLTGAALGLQAVKVSATFKPMQAMGVTHTPEVGLVFAQTAEDDAQGDSDLGTEIYANMNCVYDKNLSANLGLAFLSAGDALSATTTAAEDQLKLEAGFTYHF